MHSHILARPGVAATLLQNMGIVLSEKSGRPTFSTKLYERVYLRVHDTVSEARVDIKEYIDRHNTQRDQRSQRWQK